jgi:hypothetical protein
MTYATSPTGSPIRPAAMRSRSKSWLATPMSDDVISFHAQQAVQKLL